MLEHGEWGLLSIEENNAIDKTIDNCLDGGERADGLFSPILTVSSRCVVRGEQNERLLFGHFLSRCMERGVDLSREMCAKIWEQYIIPFLWKNIVLRDKDEETQKEILAETEFCAALMRDISGYDPALDWNISLQFRNAVLFSKAIFDSSEYENKYDTLRVSGSGDATGGNSGPSFNTVNGPRERVLFLPWLREFAGEKTFLAFTRAVIASSCGRENFYTLAHEEPGTGKLFRTRTFHLRSGRLALAGFMAEAARCGFDIFDSSFTEKTNEDGLTTVCESCRQSGSSPASLFLVWLSAALLGETGKSMPRNIKNDEFFSVIKRLLEAVDEGTDGNVSFNAFRLAGEAACTASFMRDAPYLKKWLSGMAKDKRVKKEQAELWKILSSMARKNWKNGIPSPEEWSPGDIKLYRMIEKFFVFSFALSPSTASGFLEEIPELSSREFLFGHLDASLPVPAAVSSVPLGVKILAAGTDLRFDDAEPAPPFEAAARIMLSFRPSEMSIETLDSPFSFPGPFTSSAKKTARYLVYRFGVTSLNSAEPRPLRYRDVLLSTPWMWLRGTGHGDKEFIKGGISTVGEFAAYNANMLSRGKAFFNEESYALLARKELWINGFRKHFGLPELDGYRKDMLTDFRKIVFCTSGSISSNANMAPLMMMFSLGTTREEAIDIFRKNDAEMGEGTNAYMTSLSKQLFLVSHFGDPSEDYERIFEGNPELFHMSGNFLKRSLLMLEEDMLDAERPQYAPLRLGETKDTGFWFGGTGEVLSAKHPSHAVSAIEDIIDMGIRRAKIHMDDDFWSDMRSAFLPELPGEGRKNEKEGLKTLRNIYLRTAFGLMDTYPDCVTNETLSARIPFFSDPSGGTREEISLGKPFPFFRVVHGAPLRTFTHGGSDDGDAALYISRLFDGTIPMWLLTSAAGIFPALPEHALLPLESRDAELIYSGMVSGQKLPFPDGKAFVSYRLENELLYEHWMEKTIRGAVYSPVGKPNMGMTRSGLSWTTGMESGDPGRRRDRGMLCPEVIRHMAGRKRTLEEQDMPIEDYAASCGKMYGSLFFGGGAGNGVLGSAAAGIERFMDITGAAETFSIDEIKSCMVPFAESLSRFMAANAAALEKNLQFVDEDIAQSMRRVISMSAEAKEKLVVATVSAIRRAEAGGGSTFDGFSDIVF